jgi:hypothetical protein
VEGIEAARRRLRPRRVRHPAWDHYRVTRLQGDELAIEIHLKDALTAMRDLLGWVGMPGDYAACIKVPHGYGHALAVHKLKARAREQVLDNGGTAAIMLRHLPTFLILVPKGEQDAACVSPDMMTGGTHTSRIKIAYPTAAPMARARERNLNSDAW